MIDNWDPKRAKKSTPAATIWRKKKSISSHAAELLPHIKKSPPPLSNTIFKVFVHRFFHDFLQSNALTSASFKCWFCHFLLNNWCQSRIFWKGGLSGKICHVFFRINNRYWQLWKLNDIVFCVKIWFHVIFLDRMYPNNPSKKFFNGKKRNYIKLTPHLQRNSLGKKVEAYHKKEWKSSPPLHPVTPPRKNGRILRPTT